MKRYLMQLPLLNILSTVECAEKLMICSGFWEKARNGIFNDINKACEINNIVKLHLFCRMKKYFISYYIFGIIWRFKNRTKKPSHIVLNVNIISMISRFPLLMLMTFNMTLSFYINCALKKLKSGDKVYIFKSCR